MGEDLEMFGEVDDAETLEEAESGDSGVDVQAGSKTGAEDEAESFEGIHGCIKFQIGGKFQSITKEFGRPTGENAARKGGGGGVRVFRDCLQPGVKLKDRWVSLEK